jgi:hypothetical protein
MSFTVLQPCLILTISIDIHHQIPEDWKPGRQENTKAKPTHNVQRLGCALHESVRSLVLPNPGNLFNHIPLNVELLFS